MEDSVNRHSVECSGTLPDAASEGKMTIEQMAREADMAREVPERGVAGRLPWLASKEGLLRFAALVRKRALEEAASACDNYARNYEGWAGGNDVAEGLAETIRALEK